MGVRQIFLTVGTAAAAGTALLGALAAGGPGKAVAAPVTQPNIVVIETDDQTAEQMRVMRKTLALLGREGTTFDRNFVTLSLCCPSRSTLLTGQYAHNHGVLTNNAPNGGYQKLDHTNTLAVWLKSSGYWTAHVGKYLNGYGKKKTKKKIPPGWSEWHAGVSLPYFGFTMNDNGVLHQYGSDPSEYQTDVFTQKAVDVIDRRAPGAQPFFMWVAYHAPHAGGPRDDDDPTGIATVHPAPKYKDAFASQKLPKPPSFNEKDVSDKPVGIRNRPLLTPQEIAGVKEAYQQQLESMLSVDDGVEAIVNALRAKGELERTLIIFTDDNGFFRGEHRVPSGKVLVYEPSIRVPLILRGPGVPRGRHLKQMVANIDLAPTIVVAAHAKPGRRMDGRPLWPLLRKPSRQWGRDLLIERGPGGGKGGAVAPGRADQAGEGAGDSGNQSRRLAGPADKQFAAIRTPRFLYAEYVNGEKELYDLWKDPDELRSLHTARSYAPIRRELARRLAKLRTCRGAACWAGPRVKLKAIRRTSTSRHRRCTRSNVRLRIGGADSRWVRMARFYLNGRLVRTDARAPFRATVRRSALGRHPRLSARIAFVDGRIVDRTRTLPASCRR